MSLITRIRNLEAKLGSNSAAENAYLHSVVAGTAAGNKAVVLDGNKTIDRLNISAGNFTGNLTGNPQLSIATPAAAGTVLGNATALSFGINAVTGADDTKGVSLPPAAAAKPVVVLNTVANKILKVWPFDGNQTINALAGGGNLSMGNGTSAIFYPTGNTSWVTVPKVPS